MENNVLSLSESLEWIHLCPNPWFVISCRC